MIHLMAHMIPWYPDEAKSKLVALSLLSAGTRFLEIQFPFSDPGADGPVIEAACQQALRKGFSIDRGFAFLKELFHASPELGDGQAEVLLMSYASLIFTRGIERFVKEAAEIGVKGLIVPDLPLDSDEGLLEAGRRHGVEIIPVLAANSREDRIRLAAGTKPSYIYCALRTGITGTETSLDENSLAFLARVSESGARLLAGFGISKPEQLRLLEGHAFAAVVGSAFVRRIAEADSAGMEPGEAVKNLAIELVNHD